MEPKEGDNKNDTGDKTFTQADIDKAVAEATKPYAEFDKIKADADEYGRLATNPRFATFVDEENKRMMLGDEEFNRIYGGKPTDDTNDTDDNDDDDNDKISPRERELSERLERLERSLTEKEIKAEKDRVADEYKEVSTNKEKYPLFDKTIKVGDEEIPVRELMARELDKAVKEKRTLTMAQAYRDVTYDHQRQIGREEVEQTFEKKRQAASVGIPVSSPGRTSSSPGDRPKTVREAVERTLDDLGI